MTDNRYKDALEYKKRELMTELTLLQLLYKSVIDACQDEESYGLAYKYERELDRLESFILEIEQNGQL